MARYRIRLVAESGPDPSDGTPLGRDEETITVEADSLWHARTQAILQMALRPSGRVLQTYDADTGSEVTPPPLGELRPGRFEIDGFAGVYDGFTHGEMWNGFAVPYFPLAEARRVADDYAAQPAWLDGQTRAEYDADRDLVRLFDPSSGEWDEFGPVEGGRGEGATLYSVGGRSWTWEEVLRDEE